MNQPPTIRKLIAAGLTPKRVEEAYATGRITELVVRTKRRPQDFTYLASRWGIKSIRRTP